jgi:hypothetical protein
MALDVRGDRPLGEWEMPLYSSMQNNRLTSLNA